VQRRTSKFLLLLTFFGLTPEYRFSLFTEIHEIVFHGNGGYDWHTIYNMPIWLRKFTFNKLKNHYSPKKDDVVDESIKNMKLAPKIPIQTPTYSTRASKK
jgi:hypothetical protein